MTNDILVLALLHARTAFASRAQRQPISCWDVFDIVVGEYPGLAGLSRTTVYRAMERLGRRGFVRYVESVPGRAVDRQLHAITERGRAYLLQQIEKMDVRVRDLRRPKMPMSAFMDYLVLVTYVNDQLVETALDQRIASIRELLGQDIPRAGGIELEPLYHALKTQAQLELDALTSVLSWRRSMKKSADKTKQKERRP
jgi:DNA-binding PadR family transcriptional regulator